MGINIDQLLAPISAESPCGQDLSYDSAYMELERAGRGMPERQIGEVIKAAEEPEWPQLRDASLSLLGRSKDLRVTMYLILGLVKTEGVTGFRDGLALLKGMVERYWDQFYPQLSADDNLDPMERMNILAALLSEDAGDPMRFLRRVRELPLCSSRRWGGWSLRDILVATGQWPAAETGQPAVDKSAIDAAFQDADAAELQATFAAVTDAIELSRQLDAVVTAKAGAGRSIDLAPLTKVLQQMGRQVQEYLGRRGLAAPVDEATSQVAPGQGDAAGPPGPQPGGQPLAGEVRSTQDVIAALEKICRYYERCEPSSPLPLLIRRAQKLVSKSFVEIVQELIPDAIGQVNLVGGIRPPDKT